MKITTYNLRFGGKAGHRIHWQKIFDEINPDIFLVQETRSPEHYFPDGLPDSIKQQIHWQAVDGRPWGSAVYTRTGKITPLPSLSSDFLGWVVGIVVTDIDWPVAKAEPLYIYSIHAPSIGSSYVKQVNLILDEIKKQAPTDAAVVIGGDFNLALGFRHPNEPLQKNQPKLMARFRQEFGLMNCWQMANLNQNLPQTLRWSNDKTLPFHCDGIFAPAHWYRYLERSTVVSGSTWDELSDHNPVSASFMQAL